MTSDPHPDMRPAEPTATLPPRTFDVGAHPSVPPAPATELPRFDSARFTPERLGPEHDAFLARLLDHLAEQQRRLAVVEDAVRLVGAQSGRTSGRLDALGGRVNSALERAAAAVDGRPLKITVLLALADMLDHLGYRDRAPRFRSAALTLGDELAAEILDEGGPDTERPEDQAEHPQETPGP